MTTWALPPRWWWRRNSGRAGAESAPAGAEAFLQEVWKWKGVSARIPAGITALLTLAAGSDRLTEAEVMGARAQVHLRAMSDPTFCPLSYLMSPASPDPIADPGLFVHSQER